LFKGDYKKMFAKINNFVSEVTVELKKGVMAHQE